MSCSHCERSIRDEIEVLEGVAAVDVDLETKEVVVRGRLLDVEAIEAAIGAAGYEVDREGDAR